MAQAQMLESLEKAMKFDAWGQRVEATEEYERFRNLVEGNIKDLKLNREQTAQLQEILVRVRRRGESLEIMNSLCSVTLETLKSDLQTFKMFACSSDKRFSRRMSSMAVARDDKGLFPPVVNGKAGYTYVSIKIEKIGLKDASLHVDPFMVVSTHDAFGRMMSLPQHTQPSSCLQDRYIIFNADVHLQEPLEDMPVGYAIFFQFRHYKEKKDKISTRCYAFAECDEIKTGPAALELYRKPVDFQRKKILLFTEKKLYLHIYFSLKKF